MIREIAQWIEDETAFVIGTDLFAGHRPQDAPARCTVLLERVGGVEYFDLPDKVDYALQVLNRAETYLEARADAITLHTFLHGSSGWTLPVVVAGTEYFMEVCEAQSFPASIGQDEKGYYEFSTNYIVKIREV